MKKVLINATLSTAVVIKRVAEEKSNRSITVGDVDNHLEWVRKNLLNL